MMTDWSVLRGCSPAPDSVASNPLRGRIRELREATLDRLFNVIQGFKPLQAKGIIVLIIRRGLIVLVVRELESILPRSAGRNDLQGTKSAGLPEFLDVRAIVRADRELSHSKAHSIADPLLGLRSWSTARSFATSGTGKPTASFVARADSFLGSPIGAIARQHTE